MKRLLVMVGVVTSASSCLSMGSVQTASTLGKGNFQVSAEPGMYGATGAPDAGDGFAIRCGTDCTTRQLPDAGIVATCGATCEGTLRP